MASKRSIVLWGQTHEVLVVNCDTRPSEHSDNYRFSQEIEKWLQHPITYLRNEDYLDVDDVITKTRYMSGPKGARCTTELKKLPRLRFQRPDDIHVFGYTWGERGKRGRDFINHNPELILWWPLIDEKWTKDACLELLECAGIELPTMYKLGFDNNNCPGCLKASSKWYWDMVRTHFPEVFATRCKQSRKLGVRLVEWKHHQRIFLDELPPGPYKKRKKHEVLSCGPECGGPAK